MESESGVSTPLSAFLGLYALSPTLGILPLSLSLRLSVPSFLCLCLCVDVGISIPLSLKGPCSPWCYNYFFVWTPHFSDLEMNLLFVG